jgi:conjugative transfer signal peptidase TraF
MPSVPSFSPTQLASHSRTTRPQRSTLLLAGLLCLAVGSTRGLRLNVSPSLPYGLYRLHAGPPTLTRGTLVLLPVPVSVQHVWPRWVPLLKPIAGVPGDAVELLDQELRINGVAFGPVLSHTHGQALPQIRGSWIVADGEVFVASAVPRSLDGRYFGCTPVRALTAVATPLLTWR